MCRIIEIIICIVIVLWVINNHDKAYQLILQAWDYLKTINI